MNLEPGSRIELPTSSLPRKRSTTELPGPLSSDLSANHPPVSGGLRHNRKTTALLGLPCTCCPATDALCPLSGKSSNASAIARPGLRRLLRMGREGFEPSKAEPTGLQPVPFDRSGTSPHGMLHHPLSPACARPCSLGSLAGQSAPPGGASETRHGASLRPGVPCAPCAALYSRVRLACTLAADPPGRPTCRRVRDALYPAVA